MKLLLKRTTKKDTYEGVVYKYTNPLNGKIYIGQTMHETDRKWKWMDIKTSYAGRRVNLMRKRYGPETFSYEVLVRLNMADATLLKQELEDLETRYIAFYKSNNPQFGYNCRMGGKNGGGQKLSAQARRNMSKAQKGIKKPMSEQGKLNISLAHRCKRPYRWKKVAQYDKSTGELIKVWDSLSDAVNHFGDTCCGNLIAAIDNKNRHHAYRGYKWKYYEVAS